jgi:DNA processing protein
VLSYRDVDYPAPLLLCEDPPPLLYVLGSFAEADRRSVAVVGTRQPTEYGLRVAAELAAGLARTGLTVVSGLARGIDGAAHQAALDAGGRTVAVLGHGLAHKTYPGEHRDLARTVAGHGAVVSQFPLDAEPLKHHFPLRNAVIAGLSLGTVVVEGEEDSGSLITADLALEMGREVFAVPGPADAPMSQGPLKLIQQGAKLVRRLPDLLEDLNLGPEVARQVVEQRRAERRARREQQPLPGLGAAAAAPERPALTGHEAVLHALLRERGLMAIDQLSGESRMPSGALAATLTLLELKGVVRQHPGKVFEAV